MLFNMMAFSHEKIPPLHVEKQIYKGMGKTAKIYPSSIGKLPVIVLFIDFPDAKAGQLKTGYLSLSPCVATGNSWRLCCKSGIQIFN